MDKDKSSNKVVPYYPYFHRAPNKFVRYEKCDFDDGHGNKAEVTKAIYKDKNGNLQEADAFIKWRDR